MSDNTILGFCVAVVLFAAMTVFVGFETSSTIKQLKKQQQTHNVQIINLQKEVDLLKKQ